MDAGLRDRILRSDLPRHGGAVPAIYPDPRPRLDRRHPPRRGMGRAAAERDHARPLPASPVVPEPSLRGRASRPVPAPARLCASARARGFRNRTRLRDRLRSGNRTLDGRSAGDWYRGLGVRRSGPCSIPRGPSASEARRLELRSLSVPRSADLGSLQALARPDPRRWRLDSRTRDPRSRAPL